MGKYTIADVAKDTGVSTSNASSGKAATGFFKGLFG
jgi:hypothetical protein